MLILLILINITSKKDVKNDWNGTILVTGNDTILVTGNDSILDTGNDTILVT